MIIGASVVHNDIHVFNRTLETFNALCDRLIIVDDGSTLCTAEQRDIAISKIFKKEHHFRRIEKTKTEYERRSMLWKMLCVLAEDGDWIVLLDSDECYYWKDVPILKGLMDRNFNNPKVSFIATKLHNMWTETQYRIDGYWMPDFKRRIFKMLKSSEYVPNNYNPKTIECGEVPKYVFEKRGLHTGYRLLHLGYIREEDRMRKYNFHKMVDAEGKFHLSEHIESILKPATLLKIE